MPALKSIDLRTGLIMPDRHRIGPIPGVGPIPPDHMEDEMGYGKPPPKQKQVRRSCNSCSHRSICAVREDYRKITSNWAVYLHPHGYTRSDTQEKEHKLIEDLFRFVGSRCEEYKRK